MDLDEEEFLRQHASLSKAELREELLALMANLTLAPDEEVSTLGEQACHQRWANETTVFNDAHVSICPTHYDSVICWPPTPVNSTAVVKCFAELNGIRYDDTSNATKDCFSNGTWLKAEYGACVEIMDHTTSHGIITTATIYFVGYCLSLVALAIAIGIFLTFKDLRCLRNTIHTNLMCAYMFVYFMWILTLMLELNFESHLACIVLIILLHYFHLTTFFWMFVEGLYLYILVVETLTRENFKVKVYIFIGWIMPTFFVFVWAIVKSFLPVQDVENGAPITMDEASAGNLWSHCPWMRPHAVDWIHQGPTVAVLLLNLHFLLAIMWVLITKLRSANTLETQQYRKAAKALLVLMPLLGVTYVLTIAGPTADEATKNIFDYVRAVLLSTQGLTVALFYCFLNTEVQNTLKHHWETWRTNRDLGQRSLRSGSRSKEWSPRSRTESIRLYSHPTYHKRESCTSDMTTTTLIALNGGGGGGGGGSTTTTTGGSGGTGTRASNGAVGTAAASVRSPFLQPPRASYPGNV